MSNIRELHSQGLRHYINEHSARESSAKQRLRGGNAGSLPNGGPPVGNCPRLAHLRRIGVQLEPSDEQSQTMHDGGLANEEIFFERVRRALPEGYSLVHEEDYPSKWTTSGGTDVTGRPDGVLIDSSGHAVVGIELKGVFSLTTALKALTDKPKIENLIQAAHYMMSLELERYELVYTNRNWFAVPPDRFSKVPRDSPHVQYNYYHYRPQKRDPEKWTRARIDAAEFNQVERIEYVTAGKHGKVPEYVVEPGNILPFTASFPMRFNSRDTLEWQDSSGNWQITEVTKDSIRNYYEVSDSLTDPSAKLPPRIRSANSLGKPASYNACTYCSLSSICSDRSMKTSGQFISKVSELLSIVKK